MKNSFKDLTYAELLNKQAELKKDYRDLRFNMVLSHVDNPLKLRTVKRSIARVNTIVHEYTLGIRQK